MNFIPDNLQFFKLNLLANYLDESVDNIKILGESMKFLP